MLLRLSVFSFLFFGVEASQTIDTSGLHPPSKECGLGIVEHRFLYGNKHQEWRAQIEKNPLVSRDQKQPLLDRLEREKDGRLMGIEFETSDLKVKYNPDVTIGFKFFRHGEESWCLEEDTFDDRSIGNEYRNNLECRSVGGFKKHGIDLVAHEMGDALKGIVAQCIKKTPFPFEEDRLAEFFGSNVYLAR